MKTVVVQDEKNGHEYIDIYELKDGELVEKKIIGFGLRKAKAILASLSAIEKFVEEQEELKDTKIVKKSTLDKAKALAASKL